MHCYGWSPDFVRFGITSAQGWCYYDWAVCNQMTAFGPTHERRTDGYVATERKWQMDQLKAKTNG